MSELQRPANWPNNVDPLFIEDFQKLGRNQKNELFWDGKPLVTKNQYVFTGYQRFLSFLAIVASLATISTGLNNASVFMCGRGVHWLGCPLTAQSAPAKIFLQLQEAAIQQPVPSPSPSVRKSKK